MSARCGDRARRALARHGERVAAEHLRRRGCMVLARNVRTRHGEIDLIASDGPTLVFVEVKTRRVSAARRVIREEQAPLLGLGAAQRARLRRLAAAWLRDPGMRTGAPGAIRFDAIGVLIDTRDRVRRVDHVENAW
jgi:putative endonuclease